MAHIKPSIINAGMIKLLNYFKLYNYIKPINY